ncbi:MAG: hypothetical protein U0521_02680 [Anaerolineae bacterium]
MTSRGGWAFWQPPDWTREPFNLFVPVSPVGQRTYPHFAVARLLHQIARRRLSYLDGIERSQPVAFYLPGGRRAGVRGCWAISKLGNSADLRTLRAP